MSDLLKEAIADAKAVRETALANAKMALEEAFTPQLKSMLSAKLREDEDELEDEVPLEQDEVPGDEEELMAQDEVPGEEEVPLEQDEVPGDEEELMAQDEVPGEEEFEDEVPLEQDEVPGEEEEDVIEINGVKYAPVIAEDDEELEDEVPLEQDEVPGDEDELDLEAIIKELEDELDDEEVTEQDDAYDQNVDGDKNSDHIEDLSEEEDEEEIEIDESLFEQEDEDEEEVTEQDDAYDDNVEGDKDPEHIQNMAEELKEYKKAVLFLKNKLHEVNILNAKLLFTNKLFKEFALDNNQKLRVVETFDRAQTTREIKLVYSTLAESFKGGNVLRKSKIRESASAKSGSTKPSKQSRKVITEEAQVAERFRELAGLIK